MIFLFYLNVFIRRIWKMLKYYGIMLVTIHREAKQTMNLSYKFHCLYSIHVLFFFGFGIRVSILVILLLSAFDTDVFGFEGA